MVLWLPHVIEPIIDLKKYYITPLLTKHHQLFRATNLIRNYLDATWFSMLFDFDAIIRCLQNAHRHTRAFMIHLDRHGWQIPGIEASNNSVHYHQVLIWFCSSSLGLIPCMSSGGSARHIVDRLPPPPPTCTVLLVLQLHVSTVQKLRLTKG